MPVVTPAMLLWQAAGKPVTADAVPYHGPCWWCGHPAQGMGRPVGVIADTFPDRNKSGHPSATHVCLACGWCFSEQVRLPAHVLSARLFKKLEKGGLVTYGLAGQPEKLRHLLLPLQDGSVGRWTPGDSERDRKPWTQVAKALRESPVSVGACEFLGTVSPDQIEVSEAATEKFRSFHHYTDGKTWQPFTDTERLQARDWILNPVRGPWTCCIGTGKKHEAPHYNNWVSWGEDPIQRVFFQGYLVEYAPRELARQILAAERLSFAGAFSEDIESGKYEASASPLWVLAMTTEDPILAPIRGSPAIKLVLYLTRPKAVLTRSDLWSPNAC